jgi:hypothetical protein
MLTTPTIAVRRAPENTAVTKGGVVYNPLIWGPGPRRTSVSTKSAHTPRPPMSPHTWSGTATAAPVGTTGPFASARCIPVVSAMPAVFHISDIPVLDAGTSA